MPTNIGNPSISYGVDFLLSHLSKPEFPRTVATLKTEGRQYAVPSKEVAIKIYSYSNNMDCRLAAYPYTIEYVPKTIDFVMLDLDLNNFRFSKQKLDAALKKILFGLKKNNIIPTVIWSGNGYHVLVPLEPLSSTLEDMSEFAKFKEPSKKILRFLEKYISKGKSDSVHNMTVSFSNCMLRVPGSFNSKHGNNGKVAIIQEWNNKRLSIKPLLGDFLAYLLDDANKNYYGNHNNYGYLLSKP